MTRKLVFILLASMPLLLSGQESAFTLLMSDSSMHYASCSACIIDASDGVTVFEWNADKSLVPASVLKLVTSAAAIELLGPLYTFETILGHTGTLSAKTGILRGDIIIRGGGDPALGSGYFSDHYGNFTSRWIQLIKNLGIKKIYGKVITDDSYYDYQPVPAKWLWEDTGNYYGSGAYGLSVFDNTYEIHLKTFSDSISPEITGIYPADARYDLTNRLVSLGTTDQGYVFSAPYSKSAIIEGSVPADMPDFILKASIPDPPMLLARMFERMLDSAGITVNGGPSTARIENIKEGVPVTIIDKIESPPLKDIIEVLNHESVNLFAEHLVKQLGKVYENKGSTSAGISVINRFLDDSASIDTGGIFMTDGSGLSPLDAITSRELAGLLFYMKKKGLFFNEFYSSLPEAGKEGTLKYYFRDPVFDSSVRAKSGSMTRVRSYAGYLKASSGKDYIFSILVNNYTGSSRQLISGIEEILKETIMQK